MSTLAEGKCQKRKTERPSWWQSIDFLIRPRKTKSLHLSCALVFSPIPPGWILSQLNCNSHFNFSSSNNCFVCAYDCESRSVFWAFRARTKSQHTATNTHSGSFFWENKLTWMNFNKRSLRAHGEFVRRERERDWACKMHFNSTRTRRDVDDNCQLNNTEYFFSMTSAAASGSHAKYATLSLLLCLIEKSQESQESE